MSKIQDFATQLEAEVDALKQKYEEKLSDLADKEAEIKERNNKSKSKKADLDIREKAVEKRESEVAKGLKKIRSDEDMTETLAEATRKTEAAEKLNKEVSERLDQAKLKESEVMERELAVTEREKNYRQKIRQEFADSILKK
jgi:hypothetical protein